VSAKISEKYISWPLFSGSCTLKWKNGMLEALILPSAPPETDLEGEIQQKENVSWEKILGLNGVKLDFSDYSEFQREVWRQTRKIPWGQTRSYGWLARKIARFGAARAVGGALHRNPWPLLIPCHRVIKSDGSLGGFGSGVEWKQFLLEFEQKIMKSLQDDS